MADNTALHKARKQKKDEFYTQLVDIENELRHYKPHFEGKTVYCNCDDPYESNFFRYFAANFNALGLKRLMTTSYAGSMVTGEQLSLDDIEGLTAANERERERVVCRTDIRDVVDLDSDSTVSLRDVERLLRRDRNTAERLEGDGDFRSPECIDLLRQADIVVSNPPFSLFREYVAQLIDCNKQFLVLGDQNAITYNETFSLIKHGRVWLGVENGGTKWFRVPMDYDIATESRKKIVNGTKYISMGRINWYTNLDHGRRHAKLPLWRRYSPDEYPRYDHYDIINVDRVENIPDDYEGVMGVPITFLGKHNPDQFAILGLSNAVRWLEFECITKIRNRNIYNRILIQKNADQP